MSFAEAACARAAAEGGQLRQIVVAQLQDERVLDALVLQALGWESTCRLLHLRPKDGVRREVAE